MQLVDAAEVDQVVEHGQAQRQHRHEALAPGEHLGALAELTEETDGLFDARRRVVGERGRLHEASSGRLYRFRYSGTSGSGSSSVDRNSHDVVS